MRRAGLVFAFLLIAPAALAPLLSALRVISNAWLEEKATAEKAGPDYEKTILQVQEGLTLEVMQELDARVELEKQTPKEAAAAYLKSAGYTG